MVEDSIFFRGGNSSCSAQKLFIEPLVNPCHSVGHPQNMISEELAGAGECGFMNSGPFGGVTGGSTGS